MLFPKRTYNRTHNINSVFSVANTIKIIVAIILSSNSNTKTDKMKRDKETCRLAVSFVLDRVIE